MIAARLRALVGESLVYGLSGIVARFITIFLVPIYTRLFTPEDYGVLSLVGSTVAVVSILLVLGLDNSAHRWFWDTSDELDRRRTIATWAWCQLGAAIVLGGLSFAASSYLANHIVGQPGAATYFRIAFATLPLTVFGIVLNNWLRMHRRPWATSLYAVGTTLLTIALTLLFVVGLRWGLLGIYVAQGVAYAIGTVVAIAMMQGWLSFEWFDGARLRKMLRYSLPLVPAGLAYWIVGFSDRYFVQAFTNTTEVGLYSVGSSLAAGIALITGAFQQAWGPFALSIHDQPDARRTYAAVFLYYLWGACAVSAGLSLFAPEILRILATRQYAGASTVVGILALSYVMIGLTYIASTGPAIAKRTGPTGIAMVGAAMLNILLNFALVPSFGKVGSSVATLIAQAVTPIYLFYRSQQLFHIPYRFGAGAVLVLVAAGIIGAGVQISSHSIWTAVLLKSLLLSIFIPLGLGLGLATPRQIGQLVARTAMRVRGVQAS